MHPVALVESATDLLTQVLKLEAPADVLVSAFFKKNRDLGIKDRAALAETIYAVLRQRLLWQHLAQTGSGPLARRLVLLAWRGDERTLNAALAAHEKQWLTQVQATDVASLPDKLRHNLPDWISGSLKAQLKKELANDVSLEEKKAAQTATDEEFWALVQTLSEVAPLDLRVNEFKTKRDAAQAALKEHGIDAEPTPFSPWGLRIQGKPALNKLPLFINGEVEVQDEGSQLLALLTGAKRGEMVVDFCAGAGGKTLALGAMMRNTGRLYAYDVSGHRLSSLKPRLARSGLSNVHPAQIAHERDDRVRRLSAKVDRVLVDAPCSGLGTLRRNPDLKWRQSPKAIEELNVKQAAILRAAAKMVKSGGRLVYATCSLLPSENELIAQAFSEEFKSTWTPVPILELLQDAKVANAEQLVDGDYLRLWPHRHHTDGFFAAAWVKR